jgi:hypothetical protein
VAWQRVTEPTRALAGDVWPSLGQVLRQRGMVCDVGRAMGALSMNWRPDYSPDLMRRDWASSGPSCTLTPFGWAAATSAACSRFMNMIVTSYHRDWALASERFGCRPWKAGRRETYRSCWDHPRQGDDGKLAGLDGGVTLLKRAGFLNADVEDGQPAEL